MPWAVHKANLDLTIWQYCLGGVELVACGMLTWHHGLANWALLCFKAMMKKVMINCNVLFDEEDTRISSVVPIHQNTYVMFSVPHMSSEHHKIINDTLYVVPNNPHPSID
jgi:hypothetical protein